jgi:arylsulfatase A
MNRRKLIKTFLTTAALSLPAPPVVLGAFRNRALKPAKRPNIILIVADDLGYSALGCYGNRFNETPNLDRLAREGMRFTDAYASATVCSPTRAALMTGQHPARVGITNYLEGDDINFLTPAYITINERLKSAGYVTGLIGKWHLTGNYAKSRGAPQVHNWDEVILSETEHIKLGVYFAPYFFMPNVKAREPGEYLTDRLNTEAVEFIHRHKEETFFLYLSHYAPHTNLAAKPDVIAKYERKLGGAKQKGKNPVLAAMLERIDNGVGQIMRALKKLRLEDNTLIAFTSDNGGETNVTTNAPLRAGKSWLYEGGIRVPLVVRYPAGVNAGMVSNTPVITHDWYPTFMDLAGVHPHARQPLDGISMTPLFVAGGDLSRDMLYWHYPLAEPHFLGGRSSGAMRDGDYKLIEFFDTCEVELYNLRTDIGESQNLAITMPHKVAELRNKLTDWRQSIRASMDPMRPATKDAAHGSSLVARTCALSKKR